MDRGCVNCDKFDVVRQIQWERDLAIQQLKELGYGLGEKIRTKTMYYPQVDGITPSVIEPSAQRKGKWIATKEWGGRNYSCSCCKFSFIVDTCMLEPMWNFCPNCGARMKGEEDEVN